MAFRFHWFYNNLQDMNIQDTEIVDLVSQIEEVEQKLLAHPMHKVVLNVVFL